jgi:transcriptional regulator with XRE-family HTH domain
MPYGAATRNGARPGDARALAPGSVPRAEVGARLRSLRLSHRLTQRRLAELARVSLEAVWTIESGRKYPRRSTQALLAAALGVAVAELVGLSPTTSTRGRSGATPKRAA